jgi:hypothetical protein
MLTRKILRPRDLITLFIEKLNPQYLAKFRNFRFRDMDELKEVMAEFDRERKEIVSNERIKAKINILSDFEREETDNQEPVPKVDMAALVVEKVFAMMGNSWEQRRGDNAGSGRGQGRGQPNKGSRGQQPAEIHTGNRLAGKCHYCHKEGHYARDCYKKKRDQQNNKGQGRGRGRPSWRPTRGNGNAQPIGRRHDNLPAITIGENNPGQSGNGMGQ